MLPIFCKVFPCGGLFVSVYIHVLYSHSRGGCAGLRWGRKEKNLTFSREAGILASTVGRVYCLCSNQRRVCSDMVW